MSFQLPPERPYDAREDFVLLAEVNRVIALMVDPIAQGRRGAKLSRKDATRVMTLLGSTQRAHVRLATLIAKPGGEA